MTDTRTYLLWEIMFFQRSIFPWKVGLLVWRTLNSVKQKIHKNMNFYYNFFLFIIIKKSNDILIFSISCLNNFSDFLFICHKQNYYCIKIHGDEGTKTSGMQRQVEKAFNINKVGPVRAGPAETFLSNSSSFMHVYIYI